MSLTNMPTSPLTKLYQWEKARPDFVYLKQPVNGEFQEYTWGQVGQFVKHCTLLARRLHQRRCMHAVAHKRVGLLGAARKEDAQLGLPLHRHARDPVFQRHPVK